MGKMLRETRDLRRFPMTPQQYKQFKKLAKKHKLLYSVICDKDDCGKLMDVILFSFLGACRSLGWACFAFSWG